jgi:hypothetical protein
LIVTAAPLPVPPELTEPLEHPAARAPAASNATPAGSTERT